MQVQQCHPLVKIIFSCGCSLALTRAESSRPDAVEAALKLESPNSFFIIRWKFTCLRQTKSTCYIPKLSTFSESRTNTANDCWSLRTLISETHFELSFKRKLKTKFTLVWKTSRSWSGKSRNVNFSSWRYNCVNKSKHTFDCWRISTKIITKWTFFLV